MYDFPDEVHDRIMQKVLESFTEDGEHWLWRGRFAVGSQVPLVHVEIQGERYIPVVRRWLHERLTKQEIPPNHYASTTCGRTDCVSPAHILIVSISEFHAEAFAARRRELADA